MVYATQGGTYFHTVSNCSGMSGASQITLLLALQSASKPVRRAQPPREGSSTARRAASTSTPLRTARACPAQVRVTVGIALVMAKSRVRSACRTLWFPRRAAPRLARRQIATTEPSMSTEPPMGATITSSAIARHDRAQRVPLATMLAAGRPACPECLPNAERTVYATAADSITTLTPPVRA